MLYPYHCNKCGQDHDVVKSMHDSGRIEACPVCEVVMDRVYTVPYLSGTKVQDAEYNPAFGKVVKSKYERDELAKRRGMVEVGNDYGSSEKLQKKFERDREEKREAAWDDHNLYKD